MRRKGIPQLLWAEKPCSLIGALDAALSFLGEPVDYRYLMGASAAAFRIKFHERWCVSSGFIPHPDERYDGLACRAAGYRCEYDGKGNKERRELIEASIDDGRPVLAQNLGGACDWGVIVGYEGEKLLSRNYMQPEAEYTEATDFL